jgi:hypothetical protein
MLLIRPRSSLSLDGEDRKGIGLHPIIAAYCR